MSHLKRGLTMSLLFASLGSPNGRGRLGSGSMKFEQIGTDEPAVDWAGKTHIGFLLGLVVWKLGWVLW